MYVTSLTTYIKCKNSLMLLLEQKHGVWPPQLKTDVKFVLYLIQCILNNIVTEFFAPTFLKSIIRIISKELCCWRTGNTFVTEDLKCFFQSLWKSEFIHKRVRGSFRGMHEQDARLLLCTLYYIIFNCLHNYLNISSNSDNVSSSSRTRNLYKGIQKQN